MAKFTVKMHQYVEEVAEVEVEADSPEEAVELAETMAREGDVDWSDGGDIVFGAAAEVGRPSYSVEDAKGKEVWMRDA